MAKWQSWLGQAICYTLFMALIGFFSNSPVYQRSDDQQAMIKLSLQHPGKLLGECQILSSAEIAKLPANMRIAKVCPRERSPLLLEMLIDDELIYSEQLPPRGLHNDGMSSIYFRQPVSAGNINLKVRMKDHLEQAEYPYQMNKDIDLGPAQVLVVDFDSRAGIFTLL